MARVFGYVRPSASRPDPDSEAARLRAAGAVTVLVEGNSAQARRTLRERRRLLGQIAPGDTLILEGLDRLGTSFDDMLRCFELLVDRGVDVRVLDAGFESGTKDQEAYRTILSLLSGARSSLHSEAIKQNLAVARAKGGKAPGKALTLDPEHWPEIKRKLETGTREAVAAELGVHRQTLWAFRRRMAEAEGQSETAVSAPSSPRRPI
jgi:DNA invertase Pin-like site-specific DNA recombinase